MSDIIERWERAYVAAWGRKFSGTVACENGWFVFRYPNDKTMWVPARYRKAKFLELTANLETMAKVHP